MLLRNTNYTHVGFINESFDLSKAIILNEINSYITQSNKQKHELHEIDFYVSDIGIVLDKRSNSTLFLLDKNGDISYHKILNINEKILKKDECGAIIQLGVFVPSHSPSIFKQAPFIDLPIYTYEINGKQATYWNYLSKTHLEDAKINSPEAKDERNPNCPLEKQVYKFFFPKLSSEMKTTYSEVDIHFEKDEKPKIISI